MYNSICKTRCKNQYVSLHLLQVSSSKRRNGFRRYLHSSTDERWRFSGLFPHYYNNMASCYSVTKCLLILFQISIHLCFASKEVIDSNSFVIPLCSNRPMPSMFKSTFDNVTDTFKKPSTISLR